MATLPVQTQASSRYDQPDIIATIKATICKGASDAEFQVFIEVCRGTGLNPFLKEIWFVPPYTDKQGRHKPGMIMAGRDGYLRVANEHPQFDGMETRVERDKNNIPIKATCIVWRKDRSHAISCEAYYSEYRKDSNIWSQYPSAMISKVAEVLALKRSFSINGVVTEEEIGFDGSGSTAAAQEVADRKIREIRDRRALEAAAQAVPETPAEESPSELEQQLKESIIAAERKPRKRPGANKIEMLQAFGKLKKRYTDIEMPEGYYAVLGEFGVCHSDEFPDNEEGMAQARACYKLMSLNCADLEAHVAEKREKATKA